MGKRKYRAADVKDVRADGLLSQLADDRVVVGIDVAKRGMFAAVMDAAQRVHVIVRWLHPEETPRFVQYLEEVRGLGGIVEVVMEPSGVYGDALRHQVEQARFPVFRVNPKRTHDAAEVYDGTPSSHDAKSGAIVAKLHLDGASHPWSIGTERKRQLDAAVRRAGVFEKDHLRWRNRIEALTARHWPELTEILALETVTLQVLLETYGSPAAVAADEDAARQLMRKTGGAHLDSEKVERILRSAHTTLGLPPVEEERQWIQEAAREAQRCRQLARKAILRIEDLTKEEGSVHDLSGLIGKKTAAVVVATGGDPREYGSAEAYVKALGLNLRERSSGKSKGALHITKRGSGAARMMLYMATLRLIQADEVVHAWYIAKLARMGGDRKPLAVVAVMRKLAASLWHVAKGARFNARLLFDAARLRVPIRTAALPVAPDLPVEVELLRLEGT